MTAVNPDPCDILEWDTAFFGFPVARIRGDVLTRKRVRQIDTWCQRTGVRCLYFLARADDADTSRLAENNDFRLVDIRMTFVHKAPNAIRNIECVASVRHARSEDIRPLQDIVRESYHDTRFFFDTNFPRHLVESLYETWIKRSYEGYADAVLVAEIDGAPIGYITCHVNEESRTGKIGLVGVSSQARGQGVGQALVLSTLEWFSTQGMEKIQVVTQGRNVAAQRLYERSGFLTQSVQLWYHKWYT